jgi:hypothetical protein
MRQHRPIFRTSAFGDALVGQKRLFSHRLFGWPTTSQANNRLILAG